MASIPMGVNNIEYRIVIISIYLILAIIFYAKNSLFVTKMIPKQIIYYLDVSRLFLWWGLFLDMSPLSFDILITAKTRQKTYTWSLLTDSDIGGLILKFNSSRTILAFNYATYFAFFLNDYLYNHIYHYLKNQNESIDLFKIEQIYFDSYSLNRNKELSKILYIKNNQ